MQISDGRMKKGMMLVAGKKIMLDKETENATYFICESNDRHELRLDKKTGEWICSCWWYANRYAANKEHGPCSHILACKIWMVGRN